MSDSLTTEAKAGENAPLFEQLLDLLDVFSAYCKKHDITWWACGGTMLGAVRHEGFIPWDDDMDLAMLRKDYDRLKQAIREDPLPEPYFFQSPETDPGYPKGVICLRNSHTTAIPFGDVPLKCNKGIWIDIVPFDKITENKRKLGRQLKKMRRISLFMSCVSRNYSGFGLEDQSLPKKMAYWMTVPLIKTRILTMAKLFRKLEKTGSRYENEDAKMCTPLTLYGVVPRFTYDIDLFGDTVYRKFEAREIPVPVGFDAMLHKTYGDYMKPVKAPSEHGAMIYSTEIPYEQYIAKHKEELKRGWRESKHLNV